MVAGVTTRDSAAPRMLRSRRESAWRIAVVYMVAMLGSNLLARAEVRDGLVRAGRPAATRFMVTPVVVNPFKREVVIDEGGRYEKGLVWFEPLPHFRPSGFGIDTRLDDPAVQPALADAAGAGVSRAGRAFHSRR